MVIPKRATLGRLVIFWMLALSLNLSWAGDNVFDATPLGFDQAVFDSFSSASDINWYVLNFDLYTVTESWQFTLGEAQCGSCPPNTFCPAIFNAFCPEYGLRATLYDENILLNPSAQPIFDLNPCENFQAGFSLDRADQPIGGTFGLRFLRIEDCIKASVETNPGYFLYAERTARIFPQLDTALLTGRVYDQTGNTGLSGIFLFTDINIASVSGPGDSEKPLGSYSMVLEPNTPVELSVITNSFEPTLVVIPGLLPASVTTVDVPLTPLGWVFGDGFER